MKSLCSRPSLEHLKSQAKDLLAAAKAGDAEALTRIRDALPSPPAEPALHDAQSAIAREYGFPSWQKLREQVETQANVAALYAQHGIVLVAQAVIDATIAAGSTITREVKLPPILPLVPLRNALITAGAVAPLDIGRPESLAAVRKAEAADGLIAIFSGATRRPKIRRSPIFTRSAWSQSS
jgi:hypothetical protein